MLRRDPIFETRRIIFLFDKSTRGIYVRLLAPVQGRDTFLTPKFQVEPRPLHFFAEASRLYLGSEPHPMFPHGRNEEPSAISIRPIRIYNDRPKHVIVKLRDRKFCEGPGDVLEVAIRRILASREAFESEMRRARFGKPALDDEPAGPSSLAKRR